MKQEVILKRCKLLTHPFLYDCNDPVSLLMNDITGEPISSFSSFINKTKNIGNKIADMEVGIDNNYYPISGITKDEKGEIKTHAGWTFAGNALEFFAEIVFKLFPCDSRLKLQGYYYTPIADSVLWEGKKKDFGVDGLSYSLYPNENGEREIVAVQVKNYNYRAVATGDTVIGSRLDNAVGATINHYGGKKVLFFLNGDKVSWADMKRWDEDGIDVSYIASAKSRGCLENSSKDTTLFSLKTLLDKTSFWSEAINLINESLINNRK